MPAVKAEPPSTAPTEPTGRADERPDRVLGGSPPARPASSRTGPPDASHLADMISGAAPARSFPPIEGPRAHTLLLGTMPGTASLGAHEYYAHPMNGFWPILLALVGALPLDRRAWREVAYAERVSLAAAAGFAVWDVLAECERPGSLDGRIVRATERPNDIAGLVDRRPGIVRAGLNGRTAERLFARHARLRPDVDARVLRIALPSTSPAMASLTLEAKFERWREALADRADDAGP